MRTLNQLMSMRPADLDAATPTERARVALSVATLDYQDARRACATDATLDALRDAMMGAQAAYVATLNGSVA